VQTSTTPTSRWNTGWKLRTKGYDETTTSTRLTPTTDPNGNDGLVRRIDHLVIHHSASVLTTTTDDLVKWHTSPKNLGGRGWKRVGYHLIVEGGGELVLGTPIGLVGSHVRGSNSNSVGICLVGDNTTLSRRWVGSQIATLKRVLSVLGVLFPGAVVLGHRDMPNTATECPGIDVRNLLGLSPLNDTGI